ncbi:retinol-binding protein pinta-like [Neocloeon triangulifer]|uniref:retinol-binding protein pinta-like n=1 Tax=Neocloeon triangulifer TaxID=2078957 RepID=UPI00286EF3F0|nr:retinol-binding protein pinta-like [Neocloeon triangulifer]
MPTLLVQPTGELSVQIYKDLCEDKDAVPEKMKQIKGWLAMQPHLPPFPDDHRILTFMRGCKHSTEKTKKKLDMYFSMRAAVPEFYADRDPLSDSIQKVWTEAHMPPLPALTPEGNRVIWMCGAQDELNIASAATAMKVALMIGDLRLKLEEHGVSGDVYVLDASQATAQQFAKFTPAIIRKFLISVQEAYPVRLRQVHVININPLVDVIFNFVKPLLKEKIKNRIHFHSKMDTFFKFVPIEMCPEEYGGKGGSLKDFSSNWKKIVEDNRQWFLDQESVKTDETKRPGKQMNYDELFGASGSFRKLNID